MHQQTKLNVACVLKVGDNTRGPAYDVTWVHRLYNGVKRNLKLDFNFICLTNSSTPYNDIPLVTNSSEYWNKIELFRPNLFNGPVLYLDLDVVICKDITDDILGLPTNKFLMVKEPYRDIHNSSVMFWNGDYSHLYNRYHDQQSNIIQEYRYNLSRSGCLGDQAYISETIEHDLIDNYVSTNCIGWRHHKIDTNIKDPSILIFTGTQKPSNNLDMDLVQKNWSLDNEL